MERKNSKALPENSRDNHNNIRNVCRNRYYTYTDLKVYPWNNTVLEKEVETGIARKS